MKTNLKLKTDNFMSTEDEVKNFDEIEAAAITIIQFCQKMRLGINERANLSAGE